MPSIQGYTAERMKEIEDNAVIGGQVVNGNLILTKHNNQTINAGPVLGPTGPAGPPGASNGAYGRGIIAHATRVNVQTGITSVVDVGGLTLQFTAEATRRYKVTAWLGVGSSVSGDSVNVYITDGSNNILQVGICSIPNSGFNPSIAVEYYPPPGSGTRTYKVRVTRGTGTGTVAVSAGEANPAYLTIEDIGSLTYTPPVVTPPSGSGQFYVTNGNIGRAGFRFTPIGMNMVAGPRGGTGYWGDSGSPRMAIANGNIPGTSTPKATAYAALGFNFIRINCWYDSSSGYTAQEFLNGLYDVIDQYTAAGIVCMPAFHGLTPGSNPSIASLQADSYWNLWLQGVCNNYKNNPLVWINPLNEPWGFADTANWVPLSNFLYTTVRNTGFNNIIVSDLPNWAQGIWHAPTHGVSAASGKTNFVLGFHNYEVGNATAACTDARNAGLAILVGECGRALQGDGSAAIFQTSYDWCVANADPTGYGCVWWWGAGNRNDWFVLRDAQGAAWYDTTPALNANGTALYNLAANRPAPPALVQ